jgi:iron complex outermembrane receptor protein
MNRASGLFKKAHMPESISHHQYIFILGSALIALLLWSGTPVNAAEEQTKIAAAPSPLIEMSIEELMNMHVTTVAKKPEKWFDTPAAIYVITSQDIKRSGVTSIVEALRLAPGVEVERISAHRWSVGIRGLSDELDRRMLVLVDGRSVYNPIVAGVYWDAVDYPLEDIARIEVIRGPGGTLWGANAVNGIVNIITKSAKDTQGGLVTAGGGTEEQGFGSVRYGDTIGADLDYRIYAKYASRDALHHEDSNNYDNWQMAQTGFRTDWDATEKDNLTFQGDLYTTITGQREDLSFYSPPYFEWREYDLHSTGANMLGRWHRELSDSSDWTLQAYYDMTQRRFPSIKMDVDTLDIDFQHRFSSIPKNEIIWGLGYRLNSIEIDSWPTMVSTDPDRSDNLFSAFVQDEIILVEDKLKLTVGSKFEHNDYSGSEYQPSARILWKPTQRQSLWASVSRAVRTPSPVESQLQQTIFYIDYGAPATLFFRSYGDDGFETEELLAYELGYRIQPHDKLSFAVATFYNEYDNYLSSELDVSKIFGEPTSSPVRYIFPIYLRNNLHGKIYGGEMSVEYKPFDWWRLHASQSMLQIDMESDTPLDAGSEYFIEHSSPSHQSAIQSYMNLPHNLKLDCTFRSVARLETIRGPNYKVSGYNSMDARLAWNIKPDLEVSVVGQNLLDDHHPEFSLKEKLGSPLAPLEIQRSVYGKVQWQF